MFTIEKDKVAWDEADVPPNFPADLTIYRSDIGDDTNNPEIPSSFKLPLWWLRNDLIERRPNHMSCAEIVANSSKRKRKGTKLATNTDDVGQPSRRSKRNKT